MSRSNSSNMPRSGKLRREDGTIVYGGYRRAAKRWMQRRTHKANRRTAAAQMRTEINACIGNSCAHGNPSHESYISRAYGNLFSLHDPEQYDFHDAQDTFMHDLPDSRAYQDPNDVTIHLTHAQWNLLFHMLNQGGAHVDETLRNALEAARSCGDYVGENPYRVRSNIIGQLINPGHRAYYISE